MNDLDLDLVLEQDVVEILAGAAKERVDDQLDFRGANGLPVDECLQPLEVDRFGVVLADEIGAGQEDVVVISFEQIEALLDAVGELLRCEDSIGGVDLEAVVLGRVVAARKRDTRCRSPFDHPGSDHWRGHVTGCQLG